MFKKKTSKILIKNFNIGATLTPIMNASVNAIALLPDLGMDNADPQNLSEWRGRIRKRLVKQVQPSVEDKGL